MKLGQLLCGQGATSFPRLQVLSLHHDSSRPTVPIGGQWVPEGSHLFPACGSLGSVLVKSTVLQILAPRTCALTGRSPVLLETGAPVGIQCQHAAGALNLCRQTPELPGWPPRWRGHRLSTCGLKNSVWWQGTEPHAKDPTPGFLAGATRRNKQVLARKASDKKRRLGTLGSIQAPGARHPQSDLWQIRAT